MRRRTNMTREQYLESVQKAYDEGRISEEAYDAAIMNTDDFTE